MISAPKAVGFFSPWYLPDIHWLAALVALVPLLSVFAVLGGAFHEGPAWGHVRDTLLFSYIVGTAQLVFGGVLGVVFFGVSTAWLVTMCQFPGRGFFEWALVLPFAIPAYVAGYAWAELLSTGGILQTAFGPLAFILPDARSVPSAIFVYSSVLFPYVYLAARGAFTAQSVCVLEASRALGRGPFASFWRVGLPLARPAIIAGAALAGLEIAADFGLADHFGLQTLGIGVFRAWFSTGDLATAARLAAILMAAAFVFLMIERMARSNERSSGTSTRWRSLNRTKLSPWAAALAVLFCATIMLIGVVVPFGRLVVLAFEHGLPIRDLRGPILATVVLASIGSVAALAVAFCAAWVRSFGRLGLLATQAPIVGYAAPGAVVALGVLAFTAWLGGGAAGSLAGAGALVAIALAYATRFGAAGQGPFEAGLAAISPAMTHAAASLGAGPLQRFWRVDVPIAGPSALAAALIVFVEAVKELPATLILRPLNFDTLAVRAHAYAADERLGAAAWPALLLVLVSLWPIILFSKRMTEARAGAR